MVHSPVIHRNASLRIGVLALSITLQQWLLVSDAYWVLMGEGLVDLIFVSFFFFFSLLLRGRILQAFCNLGATDDRFKDVVHLGLGLIVGDSSVTVQAQPLNCF